MLQTAALLSPCVHGKNWWVLCLGWDRASRCHGQPPSLGLQGLSLTTKNQAALCTTSPYPCYLLQRGQRECALLTSQGCKVSACPAQAACRDQLRTSLNCCQGWGSGELQCGSACKHRPLGITVWISTRHRCGEVENFLPAHLSRAGERECKGQWRKSHGELPGLQSFL